MLRKIDKDELAQMPDGMREKVEALMPERTRRAVSVGGDAFWLYSPTRADVQSMIVEIKAFMNKMQDASKENSIQNENIVTVLIETLAPAILKNIGLTNKQIDEISVEQAISLVHTWFDISFGMSNVDETVKKNVKTMFANFFPAEQQMVDRVSETLQGATPAAASQSSQAGNVQIVPRAETQAGPTAVK
jgi:hypothetical protein